MEYLIQIIGTENNGSVANAKLKEYQIDMAEEKFDSFFNKLNYILEQTIDGEKPKKLDLKGYKNASDK